MPESLKNYEAVVYDMQSPPVNRVRRQDLFFVEIVIESAKGEKRMDANGFAMACAMQTLGGELKGRTLPGVFSVISGAPAVRIHTFEISLELTPEELLRLGRRELTSGEYSALREKFGIFHEIHDDFYADDGESLQGMSDRQREP